jgi:hypothetical protein
MESKVPAKAIHKARLADPSRNDPVRMMYNHPESIHHEVITAMLEEAQSISPKKIGKETTTAIFVSLWPTGDEFLKMDTEFRIKEAFLNDLRNKGFISALLIYNDPVRDEKSSFETDAFFASFSFVAGKLIPELHKLKESTSKRVLENKDGLSILGITTDIKNLYFMGTEIPLGGGLQRMFLLLADALEETDTGFTSKPVSLINLRKIGKYQPGTVRSNLTKLRASLSALPGIEILIEGSGESEQIMTINRTV